MDTTNAIKELIIDEGFKNLIRPLYRQEYLQLEQNILDVGCYTPITTWNGVIVDGHNRYEICTRHNIPFEIKEIDFDCREEAIAWICANQLGRRNLTEETRKFLIGLQYENEKIANNKRNAKGINQYSTDVDYSVASTNLLRNNPTYISRKTTAQKIADANHISHGTVEKYAIYTRALEEIGHKEPKLVPKILSGRYKVSHNNVLELAKLSEKEVQNINRNLERNKPSFVQYQTSRKEIENSRKVESEPVLPPVPSVKDMPVYDPDAEITGLSLTIPSWISSITRVQGNSDFSATSAPALHKLAHVLSELKTTIDNILRTIEEHSHG